MKFSKNLFLLPFLFSIFNLAEARIINVPIDYGSIQAGIDSSANGDTVLVARGTYYENINFNGKNILLASNCILDQAWSTVEHTIIDGSEKGSVVTISSGEDTSAVLTGFTIQDGMNNPGAGIQVIGSSAVIRNNIITRNVSGNAGGPAIHCGNNSDAKIIGNLIYNNNGPAAISCYRESDAQIIGNTISLNSWGGISCQEHSNAVIKNNVITSNNTYGIFIASSSNPLIDYDDIWNNHWDNRGQPESPYEYSAIVDAGRHNISDDLYAYEYSANIPDPGKHSISLDPGFCDIAHNDFSLSSTSPCLGAGEKGVDIGALGMGCSKAYGMDISPGHVSQALIGQDAQLMFYIKNVGVENDSYVLSASDSLGWRRKLSKGHLALKSQQIDSVCVVISIPYKREIIGMLDKVRLTAISRADGNIRVEEVVPVKALAYYGFRLYPGEDVFSLVVGVNVRAQIMISNIGLRPDTYSISAWNHLGWEIKPIQMKVEIGASESKPASVTVIIPPDAPKFICGSIMFRVASQGNPDFVDTTGVCVKVDLHRSAAPRIPVGEL